MRILLSSPAYAIARVDLYTSAPKKIKTIPIMQIFPTIFWKYCSTSKHFDSVSSALTESKVATRRKWRANVTAKSFSKDQNCDFTNIID